MSIRAFFLLVGLTLAVARTVGAHGGPHEKIQSITASIARNPANVAMVIERADLYREIGDLTHALADYDHALRLDPARSDAHLGRSLVLLERGEVSDALAAVDTFIVRAPDVARAWRIRAQLLSLLGRVPDAVAALDRAIELGDPPVPDDYLHRAELLAALGDSRLDEAVAGLDAGLVRVGPAVTLQHLAIDLERRRGRYDAALERLDCLGVQYTRVETVRVLRGDILVQAGRTREANGAYTEALRALDERRSQGRMTTASSRLRADVVRRLAATGEE